MSTFTIEIKLQDAGYNNCEILESAMQNENFTLVKTIAFEEMEFVYYGNMDFLHVRDAVARVTARAGKKCSFTITKDLQTEKQYHKGISSLYRQSA